MKLATVLTLLCLLGHLAFAQEGETISIDELEVTNDIELGAGYIAYHDSTSFSYGLKTEDGRVLTRPIYSSVGEYIDGTFVVVTEDYKYGIIDTTANFTVPLEYDELLFDPAVNAYIYSKDGQAGLMDKQGKKLWNVSYSSLAPFIDGYAAYSEGDKYGLVDQSGKVVVPAAYESIMQFDKKYYVVLDGSNMQVYTIKDQKLVVGDFQYLFLAYVDDLFVASRDGVSYGYINGKGETVIPFNYSFAGQFVDGYANVVKTGEEEMIYINQKGEEVKPNVNY